MGMRYGNAAGSGRVCSHHEGPGSLRRKACIEGTRIRVMDIVCLHREGYAPDKMLNVFASPLTLAQVHAALAYYYDRPDEIEASFAEEDGVEAEIARGRTEFMSRRTIR